MREHVVPVDGMVITEDTRFAPGIYPLSQGLKIGADGITIEGEGALLVDQSRQGVGIHAEGRQSVTVRGIAISGFFHGLRFDDCRDVRVEDVRVRDTYEIEGIDTFLYLWHPIEEVYSAAILLNGVQGGAVRGCDLQHQMNGILLYGSSGLTVENNNASFNSGWGVYLSGSSDNVVADNRLDFCNRIFRRPESGAIRVEADAAGIVLVESSCRNKFLRNSCLCGGDGIFVAGYNHKGGKTTCDDNLFEDNDCRLSPNNAIESTFSRGNVFRRNDCSRSNYGFWMGYSWDNVVEDNIIDSCRMVGIAIEHGHGFIIRRNQIQNNREGIRLFTRGGETLKHWPEWSVSYDYTVEDNLIEQNRIGFNGYTGPEIPLEKVSYDLRIRGNTFRANLTGTRFHRVRDTTLSANIFQNNQQAAILIEQPGVTLTDNQLDGNGEAIVHTSELGHSTERSGWT
ncbi:MAG: right-handed parallel beta-helix repeat-containing protein [Anaerolineae bacterium]|nr:right-handed parallel beta-helix repeat-containing protein [Anaerolineae bacterium]